MGVTAEIQGLNWGVPTYITGTVYSELEVYAGESGNGWVSLLTNTSTGHDGEGNSFAQADTAVLSQFVLGEDVLRPTAVSLQSISGQTTVWSTILLCSILATVAVSFILYLPARRKRED